MAIKLKHLLDQHGIKQAEWMRAITQSNGKALTKGAASLLLNKGVFPKATPKTNIEQDTRLFLDEKGIQHDAKSIWQEVTTGTADQSTPAAPANDEDQLPEKVMLSQAAKKHFGLFKDPFIDDIHSADDIFISAEQRYISKSMMHVAKHGGFLAITGDVGAGKSTLRRNLLEDTKRSGDDITIIQPRMDTRKLTTRAIQTAIIAELTDSPAKQSAEMLARQVEQALTARKTTGGSCVLMIEEAHKLPTKHPDTGENTLAGLKEFFELEHGFAKLLGIILIGQLELKSKLDVRMHPECRQVIWRCEQAELLPLDNIIDQYIAHKFARIGADAGKIFSADAYPALRQRINAGRGGAYPLLVNNATTKALNLAAEIGATTITPDIIAEI